MDQQPRILFVDDDRLVRSAFKRGLRGSGFEIHLAEDAWKALEIAEEVEFEVVVTDYRMPGPNGLEASKQLRNLLPDASFLLVSGNCDLALALDAVNEHDFDFVMVKPWNVEELNSAIQRGVEQAWTARANRELAKNMVETSRRLADKETRLRESLSRARGDIADALLSSLELRDRETQRACRRVAAYAKELARAVGLEGNALHDVYDGALLHDLGKIGIPDSILLKPGPLTDEEWVVMRTHPRIGSNLLDNVAGFEKVKLMVLHHHEKWDGTGYPLGISGTAIHIGARILSVVDALDAIMSDRPYRKGQPYAAARAEIIRCSGSQFDPTVVAAFERIPEQVWADLRAEYQDLTFSHAA